MMPRTYLISGAGIAGPALAFWLRRMGQRCVVVERARALRGTGQTIDVRGTGREVLRRMGLWDAVMARTTREEGIDFVDARNHTRAAFAAGTAAAGDGFVAEVEILRGELAAALHEATHHEVEYLFGDRIVGLEDDGAGVQATFARAGTRRFDAVIAADGMRSTTRELLFPGLQPVVPLGQCMAYLTIPYDRRDGLRARWYNAPGGRVMLLRPDNLGTTRATLGFIRAPQGDHLLGTSAQRALVRSLYQDAGWEAERVLDAMDHAADFYFEEVGQVKLSSWSRGRVALLGDAAYCPSPITGMGTTLALVGAYLLAHELGQTPDLGAAFAAYEQAMRPIVDRGQKLMPGGPRLACPQTAWGIAALHGVLRVASAPVLQRVLTWAAQPSSVSLPPM